MIFCKVTIGTIPIQTIFTAASLAQIRWVNTGVSSETNHGSVPFLLKGAQMLLTEKALPLKMELNPICTCICMHILISIADRKNKGTVYHKEMQGKYLENNIQCVFRVVS